MRGIVFSSPLWGEGWDEGGEEGVRILKDER